MITSRYTGPLLTLSVHERLLEALRAGEAEVECSLDLERTRTKVELSASSWAWSGQRFPYLSACKERTIYYWSGEQFEPASRYTTSLIKLVPTEWGPPTFEIDGIKMLPTSRVSPYEDARQKVALIEPRGKRILDTCGGLGYFAQWCVQGGAAHVQSFEKNPSVIWLRSLNPWSPEYETTGGWGLEAGGREAQRDPSAFSLQPPASSLQPTQHKRLTLTQADIAEHVKSLATASFDALLHDPPRFGIAGELYSQAFYDELARVVQRRGKLFHYTGTPNKLTSGRDVPNEVANRLKRAGFTTELTVDGVLAVKQR